jgi:hypothetical protein
MITMGSSSIYLKSPIYRSYFMLATHSYMHDLKYDHNNQVQIINIITASFQHYSCKLNFPGYEHAWNLQIYWEVRPQTDIIFLTRGPLSFWQGWRSPSEPPFYTPCIKRFTGNKNSNSASRK